MNFEQTNSKNYFGKWIRPSGGSRISPESIFLPLSRYCRVLTDLANMKLRLGNVH